MKIILKNQEAEQGPTFGDVQEDQFFVCDLGRLMQKAGKRHAYIIANEKGEPFSDQRSFDESNPISRILPEVERIEF